MIWQLVLQIVLIFCNAVFACAEIAVISVNEAKLKKMCDDGNKKAKRLCKLTSNPSKFLATIQVAITLSGFIGSAFAADNFSEPLVDFAVNLGIPIPQSVLKSISVILITLILSYFTLVFGELVPKRLAMKKSEAMALGMSGIISVIAKLFAPIVWLLNISTNGVLRLLGINPDEKEEDVSEEEILLMSSTGAQRGIIDKEEHSIIKNVFAFDDLEIGQICTHRTEVTFLSAEDSLEEWEEIISASIHNKFPIYSESIDNITGVLETKKYYKLKDKSRDNVMKNAVSEPYFVHEGLKADVLFKEMKAHSANHFGIVMDEYGGVSGIITITDLLEQLVGDFAENEPDEITEEIIKIGKNLYSASGIVPLPDVEEAIGIKLPVEEFDTLGSYLLSFTDKFPKDGETVTITTDLISAKLTRVDNHRIEKCEIKIL